MTLLPRYRRYGENDYVGVISVRLAHAPYIKDEIILGGKSHRTSESALAQARSHIETIELVHKLSN